MQHCGDEIGLPNMLTKGLGEKDKKLSNQEMTSFTDFSTGNQKSSIQNIPTIDFSAENQINSIQKMPTSDQNIPTIDFSAENRKSSIQNIPRIDFSADKEEDLWNDPVMHGLSEALRIQHYALRDVYSELEAERSASATSIDDALLMISRLQDEKARLAMEAAQFKREAQEKISHAQTTLSFYENVLFRKDEEIKALQCEIEAFRHRFLSYGIHDDIGFRLSDKDGYVDMPENSLAEKNSIGNRDGIGGFLARSFTTDCESCSELKPEDSASKEIERARRMGFSEAVKNNHCDQGGEDERKQVNMIERVRHSPEDPFSGNVYLLWERIEGLQKKLHMLSEKKIVNPNLKDEWRSTCDKLQHALASYTTSLRQGLKSHWRGSVPEVHESEAKANTDQTDGPVDVHMDTTQMGDQQLFIQTHEEEFTQVSVMENSTLELMQSKIEDLNLRICALEDDESVKQAMDSLKRQQYIVKHFKQITQGFHKSKEPSEGQINVKVISLQRFVTIASLIKYFLSQLPVGVRLATDTAVTILEDGNLEIRLVRNDLLNS
ncbi:hypothetical protein SUGI_1001160 [Cryptomeria japonica]|nr:hypothetical protein SUGI_1001160 [Cryptomeria japonica]